MDRLASKSFSRKREERRDAIDKVRCPARSSGPLGPTRTIARLRLPNSLDRYKARFYNV
jgi:hypothetical protein